MQETKRRLFRIPAQGTRARALLRWAAALAFIGLWSLAVGIVSLKLGAVNYGTELFDSYFRYTGLFLLNVIPGLLIALLFFAATDRVWPAVLSSGVIITLLAMINHFKLLFRDDPLLASDAVYFTEAAQISSRYNVSITPGMVLCFIAIAAATVFAALCLKARFSRAISRIGLGVLVIAAGAALYLGAYTSESVYDFTNNLGVEFSSGYKMNQWNETDQYCCRGFMYPLIHSTVKLGSEKPDGYTKKAAQELLAQYDSADIPEDKKVNFISVMFEAYYDFSTYGDKFSFVTDPYEFYHELQSESYTGELVTNIFAGGTIDTERCYITGSPSMHEYRGAAESYARYFAENGYFTEFCHPGYGWFYNRQNVAEYLGFESSHFYEDRYNTGAGIMRDDEFFPDLRRLYEQAAGAGERYFNFSVTYQNHGPYASDTLYDPDNVYIERGDLSEESYNILSNYFWGIKLTDDSLRSFFDEFRDDAEPVVIVLFGDHKPWLGDNSTVYSELGIDLSRGSDESFYNYYETQYLIWANDAAKQVLGCDFTGDGGSFSPCYLMMKLFDLCGYEGDGYMQALREAYERLDVINSGGSFRENGVLTSEISGDAALALEHLRYLDYYRIRDWEG